MSIPKPSSVGTSRFSRALAVALPLLCLAAPSVWLMTTVPPLWRDIDAYIQLVARPSASTILLHGPLYCRLARLPLWIGQLMVGEPIALGAFLKHPHLTNVGINLLLTLQHAGLCLAAFYLISALSGSLWVRVVLAIFFAAQPLFYAFAHCLGSETLSMILILLLVGLGLRMVRDHPAVKTERWLLAACLLICCILTRHIDGLLVALFPVLFLLLACGSWREMIALPFSFTPTLRNFLAAAAVGLLSILLASAYTNALCRNARVVPRSEFGFTFLWRLNFLDAMTPGERAILLEQTARRTMPPDSRQLVQFLRVWDAHHPRWSPTDFLAAARTNLDFAAGAGLTPRFDRALNDTAAAFFYPPVRPLRAIAARDFLAGLRLTEGVIARYLFTTTAYLNEHREPTPQLAGLTTFRDPGAGFMRFADVPYFRLWDFLSVRVWCGIWLGISLLLWLAGRKSRRGEFSTLAYAAMLAGTGLLMTFVNCCLAQLIPRFALPMLELLLLSIVVLLGTLLALAEVIWRERYAINDKAATSAAPVSGGNLQTKGDGKRPTVRS